MKSTFPWLRAFSILFCGLLVTYDENDWVRSFLSGLSGEYDFNIAIIECSGGTDKGADGHRIDSHYLLTGLKDHGASARIFTYSDSDAEESFESIVRYADAFVSRVDPGEYEDCTEARYFRMLSKLADHGVTPFNSPDDMISLGAKKSLMKLEGMYFFPNSTYLYSSPEELRNKFPSTLRNDRHRVLKQNRGSKGEGVWWVHALDQLEAIEMGFANDSIPIPLLSEEHQFVKAVEASDNHKEILHLNDFLDKIVDNYMREMDDFIIDMEFLPRITEGEVRLIVSGREVLYVVDKRPLSDTSNGAGFSANLGAGASHVWQDPSEWNAVVHPFVTHMDAMLKKLGVDNPPILWTVDFIRYGNSESNNEYTDKEEKFVLSEINASCVGFSAHPELAAVISRILLETLKRLKQ
mmetsp:Transcript_13083/g.14985  ORF Transcript_13083/g.14985 Transcript_13083/m.14985 type:complete len:409 (+) Transcript_13083:343-1569(+)